MRILISLLTNAFQERENGTFPTQPLPNPKGQCQVGNAGSLQKQVHAVTTLRSGKEIVIEDPKKDKQPASLDPKDAQTKYNEEREKTVGVPKMTDERKYEIVVPFPQRLMQSKIPHQDVSDIFKGVKINILLLDAIK